MGFRLRYYLFLDSFFDQRALSYRITIVRYIGEWVDDLEKHVKQRIVDYFEQNVLTQKNPRIKGKPLSGKLAGHWSYRVGNFRVLTQIQDNEMIILAVGVGHRRDVYKI